MDSLSTVSPAPPNDEEAHTDPGPQTDGLATPSTRPAHAGSASHHGGRRKCPDFGQLPDVIWVQVLSLLGLRERHGACLACPRLRGVLATPSLWREVTVAVTSARRSGGGGGGDPSAVARGPARLFAHHKSFVEKFGPFFQHLTFYVPNVQFHEDTFCTLMRLSSVTKLQSLTLLLTSPASVFLSEEQLADTTLFSLLKAWDFSTLTRLRVDFPNILSYFGMEDRVRIIYTKMYRLLNGSEAFPHVQELDIRGTVSEFDVTELGFEGPRAPTARVVSGFHQLQHLRITVINVSDNLLQVLADLSERHGQFRSLTIEMCHLPDVCILPELRSSLWQRLVGACPRLEVNCRLTTTLTDSQLEHVIAPEAPLCRLVVEGGSTPRRVFRNAMSMARKHPGTLHSFLCFANVTGEANTASLVSMVTACTRLSEFVYHGVIAIDDLTRLASLDRQWRRFEVREDRVDRRTCSDRQRADHAAAGPGGEGVQDGLTERPSEVDVQNPLATVSLLLSRRLGFPWKPVQPRAGRAVPSLW